MDPYTVYLGTVLARSEPSYRYPQSRETRRARRRAARTRRRFDRG
jgi:hypothetical protein